MISSLGRTIGRRAAIVQQYSARGSSRYFGTEQREGANGRASRHADDSSRASRHRENSRYASDMDDGHHRHHNRDHRRTNNTNRRRRPRPTPRPVTTAERSRMESLTAGLLCPLTHPAGSLTPPLVRTVTETVFWNLHRKSYAGTAKADALIRRLVDERRAAEDGGGGTKTKRKTKTTKRESEGCLVAGRAVEAVLDSWRILSRPGPSAGGGSGPGTATTATTPTAGAGSLPAEERAESLLRHLRRSASADADGGEDADRSTAATPSTTALAPSVRAHNLVLDAYARAGRPSDAERVLRDCHPCPDVVAVNGLLKAYSVAVGREGKGGRKGRKDSGRARRAWADRAERLLRRLERSRDDDDQYPGEESSIARIARIAPNAVTYGTVLGALSKLGCEEGAARAEATLRRMVGRWRAHRRNDDQPDDGDSAAAADGDGAGAAAAPPPPNAIAFAQVLSAWARSGSAAAGRRAEALLRWMDDDDDDVRQVARPNAVCYNAAIDAWSRSRPAGEAAERAERLLREMEHAREWQQQSVPFGEDPSTPSRRRRKDGDNRNPTTVTYTSVIAAWSRSQRPDAARRAEAVLADMIYAHERMRDASIRPNKRTYGAVLAAWAASDEEGASDRAQEILDELIDRYSRGEDDDDCRPNEVMFNSTLHALSKCDSDDATDRAREVVANMWRLYDQCGHSDVRPSTTTYNSLLHCLAKHGSAREAAELLSQMERDSAIPSPDIYSYVSAIDALAAEARADSAEEARALVARVEALYRQSSDPNLKPNILLYTGLVRAAASSGELESAAIRSIEDHVRREGISVDGVFCKAVETALGKCRTRA